MSLTDATMSELVGELKLGSLPALADLALHDNKLGDGSAQALASALYRGAMPNLKSLALVRNARIGEVGRAALKAAAAQRDNFHVTW